MTTNRSRWIRSAAAVASGVLLAVTIPALVATPASAATQTITITKSGFVPMNLTIKTGDTVSFTNSDTAAHEVLFKATAGFTCTVKPLVVQPDKTQSCTWTVAGSYPYSDPNQRDRNFRGTVTVDPVAPVVAPTVSLATSASVVKYGVGVTLSGKTMPATAGTTVDILAMATGETAYTKVASVATTNGGTYTVAVTPEIQTSYRAEFQNGTARVVSTVAAVQVRPQVGLVLRTMKGVRAYFTVKVTSSQTYEGAYVLVQRKNSLGRWTTVTRTTLGAFSSDRFSVRIPNGTSRIRTLLPASQAGAGYLSSASRAIAVSR
jgi:plastocyanin